ncbi:right-handed parallel beta-helix repeat-containing protein [bacterium]|nr:right-handed parallel beta-helix repeat-containing protein [bacterium]
MPKAWLCVIICMEIVTAGLCFGAGGELYGTFEAMGVIVTLESGDDPDLNAVAQLFYREAVSSGLYRQGLDLNRVSSDLFVGSMFWLTPETTYDVQVIFDDPGGVLHGQVLSLSGQTRAELVDTPPGFSYYVSPTGTGTSCSLNNPCAFSQALAQVQAGQEIVMRSGTYHLGAISIPRSGTEGNPIIIRGFENETAVLDGADPSGFTWLSVGGGIYRTTLVVADTHLITVNGERLYPYQTYADLQGLIWGISGFYVDGTDLYVRLLSGQNPATQTVVISRYNVGISVDGRNHIRFRELTFRHYGLGDWAKAVYFNNANDCLVQGCSFEINDLGIGLKRASHRTVIQDNTFRDTIFDWPWDAVKQGAALETGGVRFYDPMTGRGTVIRRNIFYDFFDGFGVCPEETAAITNETDIYDNVAYQLGDDGLETDGQCSNVRIWHNTFHNVLIGISLAPVYGGPVYAIRNLIYRTGAGNNDYGGSPFKFNSGYDQSGPMFLFHNTADAVLPGSHGLDVKSPGTWTGLVSRNNIWSGTELGLRNVNTGNPIDLDYDNISTSATGYLVYWASTYYSTLTAFAAATGQELNGFNHVPVFQDPINGDYHLVPDSNLVDQGCFIPGINDDYSGLAPDPGAFETSTQEVPALSLSSLFLLVLLISCIITGRFSILS